MTTLSRTRGRPLAGPSHSDRRAVHGRTGKRWQHLLRKATQGREPARTVEQHVCRADVTQRLELGTDLVRRAVKRPSLGGLPPP